MATKPLIERNILPVLREALQAFRVVVLNGPRQSGKSTVAMQLAGDASYVSLDEPAVLSAAKADPMRLIQGRTAPVVLDEVQRVGEPLVLAVKRVVNGSRAPGRFLLTGSVNFLTVPTISESLVGRAVLLQLHPLSVGELEGRREVFLDKLVRNPGSPPGRDSDWELGDYLKRVCEGGFPEVHNIPPQVRKTWFSSHVDTVVLRDVATLTGARRVEELPRLLEALAARTANELVLSNVHNEIGLGSILTTTDYFAHLRMTHLVHRLRPWSRNLTSRAKRRSKVYIADTGLAAYLMGVSEKSLTRPPHTGLGQLMETFVVNEIAKQASWLDRSLGSVDLFHYRDRNGLEADLIISLPDGRVAAVEVKSSITAAGKDWANLEKLRGLLGDQFACGVLFYSGPRALVVGDRIHLRPIESLWQT